MSQDTQKGLYCCVPPTPGRRMLTLHDGTQVGIMGLNEILADIYAEGRQASADTAEEILERLAEHNYITPSFRQQYCEVLLEEYRQYVTSRTDKNK